MTDRKLHLAAAAMTLALVGCGSGGGGGDATPPPTATLTTEIPSSANTSEGAFNFVRQVVNSPSDTNEPFLVGDGVLGTSETDEPRTL